MYAVKEIFYTLQGEGANAGRAAVFCRFAGCNLWSGREQDRADAQCRFCDTDFVGTDGEGGGPLCNRRGACGRVRQDCWRRRRRISSSSPAASRCCRSTSALIAALHARGFTIAIETNGTLPVPAAIDWICVSPKAGTDLQAALGRRIEARLSASRPRSGRPRGARLPPSLPAADGWGGAGAQYRARYRLLQGAPGLAPFLADP